MTVLKLIVILPAAVLAIAYVVGAVLYQNSEYRRDMHAPFSLLIIDREAMAAYRLTRILKSVPGESRILFGCAFDKDTDTSADIVFIHESGIYIIESRAHSGTISGTEESESWLCVQRVGKSRKKVRFPNPLSENRLHAAALNELTGGYGTHVYSYIVFGRKSKLRNVPFGGTGFSVVPVSRLLGVLKRDAANRGMALSVKEIRYWYNVLKPYSGVKESRSRFVTAGTEKETNRALSESMPPETIRKNSAEEKPVIGKTTDNSTKRVRIEYFETYEAEEGNDVYDPPAPPEEKLPAEKPPARQIPVKYYSLDEVTDDMFELPEKNDADDR